MPTAAINSQRLELVEPPTCACRRGAIQSTSLVGEGLNGGSRPGPPFVKREAGCRQSTSMLCRLQRSCERLCSPSPQHLAQGQLEPRGSIRHLSPSCLKNGRRQPNLTPHKASDIISCRCPLADAASSGCSWNGPPGRNVRINPLGAGQTTLPRPLSVLSRAGLSTSRLKAQFPGQTLLRSRCRW